MIYYMTKKISRRIQLNLSMKSMVEPEEDEPSPRRLAGGM